LNPSQRAAIGAAGLPPDPGYGCASHRSPNSLDAAPNATGAVPLLLLAKIRLLP
jgi:hypothetical protein